MEWCWAGYLGVESHASIHCTVVTIIASNCLQFFTDMKALSPKERFKAFAERWASLEEEDREDFARRAAALELSEADKDKKWRANMKKMVQLVSLFYL